MRLRRERLRSLVRGSGDHGRSSLGFEEGTVAAAAYFGFLGIIILILERRSNFVRFHAVQSTLGFGVLTVFWLCVKWIGSLSYLAWAPGVLALVFVAHMMLKAYHGEEYKLPIIGNLALSAVYETSEDLLALSAGDSKNEDTTEGG